MFGLFQEHGPCLINNDSSTIRLNPQSWNENSNVYVPPSFSAFRNLMCLRRLYVDQPISVGFSYGVPTTKSSTEAANGVWRVSCSRIPPLDCLG